MKKTCLVLLLNIFFTCLSSGQVTLIEVDASKVAAPPPLPTTAVINQLLGNQDLFAERIFEYHSLIKLYDFIIKGSGSTHTVKIPELSYTALSSPSKKIMKNFSAAAESLYAMVKALPPGSVNPQVNQMVTKYQETLRELLNTHHKNDSLELELTKLNTFRNRSVYLLEESVELRQMLEEKDFKSYQDIYKKQAKKMHQILTIAPHVNIFQFHDDNVSSGISPGIRVELSPWKIFGFWFDYTTPKFSYKTYLPIMVNGKQSSISELDFRVNFYAIGAQIFSKNVINLPFMGNAGLGVKLAYGYYFSYWKAYNIQSEQTNADYHTIRAEINLHKYDFFTPIEVYVAYSFYFGADKIKLNSTFSTNTLSSANWGAVSLGLRFCLWKTPNY